MRTNLSVSREWPSETDKKSKLSRGNAWKKTIGRSRGRIWFDEVERGKKKRGKVRFGTAINLSSSMLLPRGCSNL